LGSGKREPSNAKDCTYDNERADYLRWGSGAGRHNFRNKICGHAHNTYEAYELKGAKDKKSLAQRRSTVVWDSHVGKYRDKL